MFTFAAALFQPSSRFPTYWTRPGRHGAEAGAACKGFKVGDRVWATNQGSDGRPGTFAEFAAVDKRWLHPIPPGVSDEDIVALSLTGSPPNWPGALRGLEGGEVLVRQWRLRRRWFLRGADGKDPRREGHCDGRQRGKCALRQLGPTWL